MKGHAMNVESEIQELKRRVGDLEGAVSVLTGQAGKVHPDLIKLSSATAASFDRMEALVGRVAGRLDLLNTQVWSLRDDLPHLLATANAGGGKSGPSDAN
jgi:hypothetical protein